MHTAVKLNEVSAHFKSEKNIKNKNQILKSQISGDCGKVSRCKASDPEPARSPKSGGGRQRLLM